MVSLSRLNAAYVWISALTALLISPAAPDGAVISQVSTSVGGPVNLAI